MVVGRRWYTESASRLFVLPQDETTFGIDADTDAVQVLEVYYYATHRFVIIHSRFFLR